jgi:hypothetical protein
MFAIKSLVTLGLVAVLAACSNMPVPKVAALGQYGLIYSSNKPIMQMDYGTAETCGIKNNDQSVLDKSAREALASGVMRLSCEKESVGDALPYIGTIKNIVTNEIFEARFLTAEACKLIFNDMAKNSTQATYNCPTENRYLYLANQAPNQFEIQFEFQNQSECNSSQLRKSPASCSMSSASKNLRETGYIKYKKDDKTVVFRISSKDACRDFDLGSTINKSPFKVFCDNLF